MSKQIALQIIKAQFQTRPKEERTESHLIDLINSYVPHEGINSITNEEKEVIFNEVYTQFYRDIINNNSEIQIVRGITLTDPNLHHDWNLSSRKAFYWDHFELFLNDMLYSKHGPEVAARISKSLDLETEQILEQMEDPRRSNFASKGLVVGYVQSGKTQNFTGLIAKCADAGYRFIVVLAGMYNSLRLQTQIRIDRELTGYNPLNLDEDFVEWSSNHMRWEPLTSAGSPTEKTTGEFENLKKGFNDIFGSSGPPVIAVVKKNKSVLTKLNDWVDQGSEEVRNSISVLVIDDEADQASIDTAKDDNLEPTAINDGIRTMLEKFKRHSYIGYTATPFANVLIGRDRNHPVLDNDLYPRNFIHILPEPDSYSGTFRLFGEEFSHFFHVEVNSIEKNNILNNRVLPEMLDRSILTFILSIGVRKLRGDGENPMSMLVHIGHLKVEHEACYNMVSGRIDDMKVLLNINNFRSKELINKFKEIYFELKRSALAIQSSTESNQDWPEFKALEEIILEIIKGIDIYKLNSDSDHELDYISNPALKVIAIGGNQLSRGLTLEGLMTTYFLRDSKQYDTLLQMGRWFGYRPGFEDLVRIFTSKRIISSFTHLALVEQELRENLRIYRDDDVTPADIAPVIRDHSRLNVTSRNKMRDANRFRYYGRTIEQTIWLPLNDISRLKRNVEHAEELINTCQSLRSFISVEASKLYRNIGSSIITKFLRNYEKPDSKYIGTRGIDIEDILRYIEEHNLSEWNVCIASSYRNGARRIEKGPFKDIALFERSRKKNRIAGAYNIGVLSSKNHFRIDLDNAATDAHDGRKIPLIVIYRIDRFSSGSTLQRENLFEGLEMPEFDPVGFAIVFPSGARNEDEYDYIGQIFD